MAKIVAKLNLNKTPQLVEDNSLIYAKNIRLLKDGTIGPDTSLDVVENSISTNNEHIGDVTEVPEEKSYHKNHYITIFDSTKYNKKENPLFKNIYFVDDGLTYKDLKFIIDDFSLSLSNVYNADDRQLIDEENVEFVSINNKLVASNYNNARFIYLIHTDSYSGNKSFSELESDDITPFYIGFVQEERISSNYVINNNNYIIINPVTIIEENVAETITPAQTREEIMPTFDPTKYVGQIVGLNDKIYFFKEASYSEFIQNGLEFPINDNERIRIFEYDENLKTFSLIKCSWRYSGGIIDGQVTTNNTNELILTICEYFDGQSTIKVPIKHINLSHCSETDDETIYTQAPNIPFTNLSFIDYYQCTIPNGVYQFFVRYKIRDDFYTEWFPCSNELYAGSPTITNTIQGSLKYIDIHKDCPRSFILKVQHLFNGRNSIDYTRNFSEFQIGFILSNNDATVARSWKSFSFSDNINKIYFDYDKNSIEEINIDEVIKATYDLYNVKNITYYKNKYFISNYEESDFNPDLQEYANNVVVELDKKTEHINIDVPRINGKAFEKSNDSLEYFDKYNGEDVKELLSTDIVNTIETNNTTTEHDYYNDDNYVLKIQYYHKKAQEIDADTRHYKRDVCWLHKLDKSLSFNNNDEEITFRTYDYERFENPGTAGLIDYDVNPEYPLHSWSLWYDKNNHTAVSDIQELKYKWYWRGGFDDYSGNPSIEINHAPGNGWPAFTVMQAGVTTPQYNCGSQWRHIYIDAVKNRYPSVVVSKILINYNGGTKQIVGGNNVFNNDHTVIYGKGISNEQINDSIIKNNILDEIKAEIKGVVFEDNVGKFLIQDDNNNLQKIQSISVSIVKLNYNYKDEEDTSLSDSNTFVHNIFIQSSCIEENILFNCQIDGVQINSTEVADNYRTLMPFTEYEFYIHYVKQNGVNTNGYLLGNGTSFIYNDYTNIQSELDIIYPKFSNVIIPDGYVGYFISINKIKNDVARLFNVRLNPQGKDQDYIYADCLECDTMLYPLAKNITICKKVDGVGLREVSRNGEYFSSGNNNPISEFGNCGEVRWPKSDDANISTTTVYDSVESNIFVSKNNVTGGILLRCGVDNNEHTSLNLLFKLSDYDNSNTLDISALESAINLALSDYECLEVEVTERYSSIWEEVSEYEESTDRSDIIPTTELTGYNIRLFSKTVEDNNVLYNNIIFLGLSSIDSADISNLLAAVNYVSYNFIIDGENYMNSIIVNQILKDIADGNTVVDDIDSDIATILLKNIVYAELSDNTYWIKIPNDATNNKNKRLIKITPYINTSSYNNPNQNLPGFINTVVKLEHGTSYGEYLADSIYVSGTDVYTKEVNNDTIILNEYDGFFSNNVSKKSYIPSNFNLNCVTLSEDITQNIRSFRIDLSDPDSELSRQFIKAVNTLTSSSILTLPTMYYDFIRKKYSVYSPKQQYIFNNTIRSSDTNVDEVYKNIYKFRAEDYYNVPTNRGIITKIFNLVNYIYVHTEHSLFKFSGVNNLTSEEGDVALKESDVFQNGIQELFDSKHGFAGLRNKSQCLIMFDSYVFWDDYVKQIYAFGGEGKLSPISDPISKIIKEFNPTDVSFAADENHDRFFINLKRYNENICLTYNFRVNSIISIHDLDFNQAFNSRFNTYFVHTNKTIVVGTEEDEEPIYRITGWSIYRIVDKVTINNKDCFAAYRNCWTMSKIKLDSIFTGTPENGIATSCLDVITNNNYESIKNLEYINWICSEIKEYDFNSIFTAEETFINKYAGDKIMLYSDTCSTTLINLVDNNGNALISNNSSINDPNSWQYPRYNCGIWSLNYFRDLRNIDDIFNYGEHIDLTQYPQRGYLTQEDSVLYGKYIVCRFIFTNRNFKLENITFKVNNYVQVK